MMGQEHLAAIQAQPLVDMVGVADPAILDSSRTRGIPHFADYRDMLKTVKPDGVIVATPPQTHVEIGIHCIEQGVPSLIEKPVSIDLVSALRLEQVVASNDVPVLIGHNRRHNSVNLAAKKAIDEGRLGDILAVNTTWLRRKSDHYFADKWKTLAGGGGVILINVVHDFDCLRMLCGEIEKVSALTSNKGRGFEVEDTGVVMLQFASGALGTMTISDATQAPWCWEYASGEDPRFARHDENTFLICGNKASLTLPSMYLWENGNGFNRDNPLTRTRLFWEPNDS
ncbi:MAG: Gfo/Idh/MocA family protein, partial [Planctomycetaceae bacterium]